MLDIPFRKLKGEDIKSGLKVLKDKGAFHIFFGNFIMKFIGLFGSIFIVRLLEKSEYGTLGYVENLYSYGYIFAGLGLGIALLRYGVVVEGESQKKGLYFWTLKLQTLLNFCLVIGIILFAWLYPHPSEYSEAGKLLTILILGLPFQDIQNTNLSFERSQLSNKRYMYFSLFAATLSVGMRVVGSSIYGIKGTVSFRVFAEIFAGILIMGSVYKKYFAGVETEKIDKILKKEILKFSINNMIANGIWVLFMITDTFLIGRLLNDPEILADYKVAYVMPSNMSIVAAAIAVFVTPYFIKHEKEPQWVRRNYMKVLSGNIVLIAMMAAVMFIFSPQIIYLLYGKQYLNTVSLMRLLLIAHFFNAGIKSVTASLLAAMGYAKENMCISLFAFILQILMATFVLPRFGIMGLAVNNIFVYLLMSLMLVIVFAKKVNILTYKNIEGGK